MKKSIMLIVEVDIGETPEDSTLGVLASSNSYDFSLINVLKGQYAENIYSKLIDSKLERGN